MTLIDKVDIEIRFSEVDMMKVVWHGSYPKYLEDAREAFGQKYGLTYQGYINHHCYAPIVDMQIQYRKPLRYGCKAYVVITYKPMEAAKIIFQYEIRDREDNSLYCRATTTQVFMDMNYQLLYTNPEFFDAWKNKWQQ